MLTKIFIMISIYTISCPFNERIYYVGQTKNFNQRVSMHLDRDEGNPKSDWIKQLKHMGVEPVFKIEKLAKNRKEALHFESELIRDFISKGEPLLNVNYRKAYYKYNFDGKLIDIIISIKGDKEGQIKMNRLSYLGHVYNTEPIFPKWKVDEYRRSKSVRKKSVHQYTKKGEFVKTFFGVREACRITGIDHRSIAQVAGGSKIRKSAGGFLWKYEKL